MTFPPGILRQHIAIVGKTGSGKSFTAKLLVEGLLEEKRRVCVIDPTGVWWGLRSSADGSAEGFSIAVIGGEHGDIDLNEHAGAAVAELVAGDNFPCVIDVSEFSNAARTRFMTDFAEKVYTLNRQSLHLVIDEADEFAPQSPLPESKRMLGAIDRIVRRGRVRGFRVVMISQRPAVLHKNVLTQCNALVAMRLVAPQDRKALEEWIKGHDDTAGAKVLSSLAKLETGEGWLWAPDEGVLERTKFPRIRTFDSGRTPNDDEEIPEPKRLAAVDVSKIAAALKVETEKPVLRNGASDEAVKINTQLRTDLAESRLQIGALEKYAEQLADIITKLQNKLTAVRVALDDNGVDASPATFAPLPAFDASSSRESVPIVHEKPASLHKPRAVATRGDDPLLTMARTIWPAKLSWSQLASCCGRKARGGHFNATRKRLIDTGVVREEGGLVVLTDPPDAGDAVPAEQLEANLPQPAQKMFRAIRARPMSIEQLGAELGMQTRGGHWNHGMAVLRQNDLVIADGSRLRVNPVLERL